MALDSDTKYKCDVLINYIPGFYKYEIRIINYAGAESTTLNGTTGQFEKFVEGNPAAPFCYISSEVAADFLNALEKGPISIIRDVICTLKPLSKWKRSFKTLFKK